MGFVRRLQLDDLWAALARPPDLHDPWVIAWGGVSRVEADRVAARLHDALRHRAPDDPRWTVALVDAERDVRERAMHAVSRLVPAGTCDAVIGTSPAATDRGIDDGCLVLTTIPGGCEAALEPLARDPKQPAKIRGMALEALAILGSSVPRRVGAAASAQPGVRVHVERAQMIAKALSSKATER